MSLTKSYDFFDFVDVVRVNPYQDVLCQRLIKGAFLLRWEPSVDDAHIVDVKVVIFLERIVAGREPQSDPGS